MRSVAIASVTPSLARIILNLGCKSLPTRSPMTSAIRSTQEWTTATTVLCCTAFVEAGKIFHIAVTRPPILLSDNSGDCNDRPNQRPNCGGRQQ